MDAGAKQTAKFNIRGNLESFRSAAGTAPVDVIRLATHLNEIGVPGSESGEKSACFVLENQIGHSFLSLYYEPHSTDILFDHHPKRTFFTQIVSHTSVTKFELVKPVINSDEG
ncbi:hypothetical protein EVAR_2573_1 [Eumeta japonica]|uniref:Uncharacterized protein n=1 Tax=Eumeta variegata TaxID=151549 RepID=A0A4C1SLK6_EUMVA|nr:hypothetical protein EVAR_2573_1 [Eumeta japonica]